MKLYKFRSLGSDSEFVRAKNILETGKFWCSQFWELNDPMEGIYWFNAESLSNNSINDLYNSKSRIVLCSFSGKNAFENPIMWGYYANGFKGIAIEIEVGCPLQGIAKVKYATEVANIEDIHMTDEVVKQILTTKLCCWSHEEEYRYLCVGDRGLHQIGRISSVFFGTPYEDTVNFMSVAGNKSISEYKNHVTSLKEIARTHGINCTEVIINKCTVSKKEMTEHDHK